MIGDPVSCSFVGFPDSATGDGDGDGADCVPRGTGAAVTVAVRAVAWGDFD